MPKRNNKNLPRLPTIEGKSSVVTTALIIIPKAYVYKLKMNNFSSLGGEEGPRGREKPMISLACVVYINLKALIFDLARRAS